MSAHWSVQRQAKWQAKLGQAVWVSKTGTQTPVRLLTNEHLFNIIACVLRHKKGRPMPVWPALLREASRRLTSLRKEGDA